MQMNLDMPCNRTHLLAFNVYNLGMLSMIAHGLKGKFDYRSRTNHFLAKPPWDICYVLSNQMSDGEILVSRGRDVLCWD